ncbi:MAG: 1,3-beta-galactosyl-N-acetylhexosamine phosphorylase [Actinomycetaceae bacterium]|nr:1,3-beta-galactosyl-N-acetylhexosamine phosphorylase [Actinomycetaceae bacterium]
MPAGRLTLPIETGIDEQILQVLARFKADAVRNSDGTELPALVSELATKVYSTYFPARGDQEWALGHPDSFVHQYLMSAPRTSLAEGPLEIDPMAGYFPHQFVADIDCDVTKYWQVIDRTTGETVAPSAWHVTRDLGEAKKLGVPKANLVDTADQGKYPAPAHISETRPPSVPLVPVRVIIENTQVGHEYTVNVLAKQIWDSTQMYNYVTNDWYKDPARHKELPYDAWRPEVWQHMQEGLDLWLAEHPEVDVVRFTTFFYHFTIAYDYAGREKFVEWFGYSASVSIEALQAFAAQYGYELTPEDFVDQGFYNNPFRSPSRRFLDWIDFLSAFVASRAKVLVDKAHAAGKEAMMFLGDNWIGTEPYGPHFADIGMDAVVGSVGSAATCRMISDIPGVRYTEGRFLPYFFPDVFCDEGDPVGEANESWRAARRAIMRSPLDRIGYGGYLSLALKYPRFMDRMEEIVAEFRGIHAASAGKRPVNSPVRVSILNAWGALRSWQTHMVSHAQYYRLTHPWIGVLEALAGLPFDVRFVSFDQILSDESVLEETDVLINVGAADTAFSGGSVWENPQLLTLLRAWVAGGGGFIGVGEPSAHKVHKPGASTHFFQMADVLGVDKELGQGLSSRRPQTALGNHYVLDGSEKAPGGKTRLELDQTAEDAKNVFAINEATQVLALNETGIRAAVNSYGKGHGVYLAGLPYSETNACVLYRAILWAAGFQARAAGAEDPLWYADDPRVEVAVYTGENGVKLCAYNNTEHDVTCTLHGSSQVEEIRLRGLEARWFDLHNP